MIMLSGSTVPMTTLVYFDCVKLKPAGVVLVIFIVVLASFMFEAPIVPLGRLDL